MNAHHTLMLSLTRLAQLQKTVLDRLAVQEAVESAGGGDSLQLQLKTVMKKLRMNAARWVTKPEPTDVPALIPFNEGDWGVLRGQNAQGEWVYERWDEQASQWRENTYEAEHEFNVAVINMVRKFNAGKSPVFRLIRDEVFSNKRILMETMLGSIVINVIALGVSLYTMQVYDRVVPTGATQTLMVLTLGVFIAIFFDFCTKMVRSKLYEHLINQVDQRLSRSIYLRFLMVRLDQLPQSVGSLASQMRGYEVVRGFLTSVTNHVCVDAPFAFLFALVIAAIGGWIALIPLTFFFLSIIIGLFFKNRIYALTEKTTASVNFKTGLLVESIEGAETIKSGQGGWRMLTRWMDTTDEARVHELDTRKVSEYSQYLVGSFQQSSYILLVASGALMVSMGEMTMGGLIACTILSGRILAPVAQIPSLLVQWANVKTSIKGLDQLWALEDDHHGQEQPLTIETIRGKYQLDNVKIEYGESLALSVEKLAINAGEKIAVLGPVGAGKTTLLRILSGMYKPQTGRVLIDAMDIAHVSKPILSEHIGFLQQEGRLFAGTLRDNLILGLIDPGDQAILEAAETTGLLQAVIEPNAKGLEQAIYEGGTGLSGGQRQLVNFTRAYLRNPNIWLLDEPTASMDRNLESKIINVMRATLKPEHTFIVVTHKMELLPLVDRIIVIANHQIMMDGPKDQVMQALQGKPKMQEQA